MLVVGLGNYGREYTNTRHNAGFLVVDYIAGALGVFWLNSKTLKCELAKDHDLLLCKPNTYMNNSGFAVQACSSYYKLSSKDILVIHDDIDLPLGQIKFKFSGGSAGHNGLKSIDSLIGRDYYRVRIGIGRPEGQQEVADYVLGKFTPSENVIILTIAKRISDNLHLFIDGKIDEFKAVLS